jgi:hypothetical protein
MKVQIGEIRDIVEGIDRLPEIAVKPAYWLGRIRSYLLTETQKFEKTRLELIKKYSETDDKGNIIRDEKTGQPKNLDKNTFQEKYLEVLNREIDIPFKTIKLEELKLEKVKPEILAKLEKIVVL